MAFVAMLREVGGLRDDLSADEAVDTLSGLANPDTYRFLTTRRGFTATRYQRWLADAMAHVLLPGASPSEPTVA